MGPALLSAFLAVNHADARASSCPGTGGSVYGVIEGPTSCGGYEWEGWLELSDGDGVLSIGAAIDGVDVSMIAEPAERAVWAPLLVAPLVVTWGCVQLATEPDCSSVAVQLPEGEYIVTESDEPGLVGWSVIIVDNVVSIVSPSSDCSVNAAF